MAPASLRPRLPWLTWSRVSARYKTFPSARCTSITVPGGAYDTSPSPEVSGAFVMFGRVVNHRWCTKRFVPPARGTCSPLSATRTATSGRSVASGIVGSPPTSGAACSVYVDPAGIVDAIATCGRHGESSHRTRSVCWHGGRVPGIGFGGAHLPAISAGMVVGSWKMRSTRRIDQSTWWLSRSAAPPAATTASGGTAFSNADVGGCAAAAASRRSDRVDLRRGSRGEDAPADPGAAAAGVARCGRTGDAAGASAPSAAFSGFGDANNGTGPCVAVATAIGEAAGGASPPPFIGTGSSVSTMRVRRVSQSAGACPVNTSHGNASSQHGSGSVRAASWAAVSGVYTSNVVGVMGRRFVGSGSASAKSSSSPPSRRRLRIRRRRWYSPELAVVSESSSSSSSSSYEYPSSSSPSLPPTSSKSSSPSIADDERASSLNPSYS
mmetsp:Transcript_51569/g.158912  ORF Transcript_51569/g.158912 Transcript_51569/m.158912 type:complete len:438 (-) Transcript_51569:335-1648(-)